MSGVIRWEEPPQHGNVGRAGRGRSKWDPIAEALRSSPGQWAVVAEGVKHGTAGSMVACIKSGRLAKCFLPAGTFEARSRATPSGGITVYARYVGEPS